MYKKTQLSETPSKFFKFFGTICTCAIQELRRASRYVRTAYYVIKGRRATGRVAGKNGI